MHDSLSSVSKISCFHFLKGACIHICPLALNFDSEFIRGNAYKNTTERNLSGHTFFDHRFWGIASIERDGTGASQCRTAEENEDLKDRCTSLWNMKGSELQIWMKG